MFAGVGPESWSAAPFVTAPPDTGSVSLSGPLLTCSSPTTGSSGTSSPLTSTTGSGGSPTDGVLWLPSTSGSVGGSATSSSTGGVDTNIPTLSSQSPSDTGAAGQRPTSGGSSPTQSGGELWISYGAGSAANASKTGSTGSGGLLQLPYDASQSTGGAAQRQLSPTGSTTSTLADAQSTGTCVPLVHQQGSDDEPIYGSTVWTGGDGGWQYFLTAEGGGTVDGGDTEDEPQGEPLPMRWLGGTGYSQFRSLGDPGWEALTPIVRPGDVEASKNLTGLARMIRDHGSPISVRAADSKGRVLAYTFADGTSYMEPVEPPSEQYINSAAAVLPGAIALRGGKGAIGAARAIATEAIEDALSDRASQAADDATGGYLGSIPVPLLQIILGARPKPRPGVIDDAADSAKNAGTAVARGADDVPEPAGRRSPTTAPHSAYRAPAPENYRGRYNSDRHAQGRPRLPDDYDAHHRIPQEYADHPDFQGYDFHQPSNIQGVKGSRADVNIHQLITNDWAEFRRSNPNATKAEIEAFAAQIDALYAQHWFQ